MRFIPILAVTAIAALTATAVSAQGMCAGRGRRYGLSRSVSSNDVHLSFDTCGFFFFANGPAQEPNKLVFP